MSLARSRRRASRYPRSEPGSGATKTLPSPSTASPVKHARPATNATWSGAWPGVATTAKGPNVSPSSSVTSAGWRAAPTGGSPAAARSAAMPSVWSAWSCVIAMPPMPPRSRASDRIRVRCDSRSGPGSTTQHGSRPTSHVFVPPSVYGLGLSAVIWAMSWVASASMGRATLPPAISDPDVDDLVRRTVRDQRRNPRREVARHELVLGRLELGDRPPAPLAEVLALGLGQPVAAGRERPHPREEPALALVVLDAAPAEHVPPPPQLGPKCERREARLLGHLTRGRGADVLARLEPAAGRKPERA